MWIPTIISVHMIQKLSLARYKIVPFFFLLFEVIINTKLFLNLQKRKEQYILRNLPANASLRGRLPSSLRPGDQRAPIWCDCSQWLTPWCGAAAQKAPPRCSRRRCGGSRARHWLSSPLLQSLFWPNPDHRVRGSNGGSLEAMNGNPKRYRALPSSNSRISQFNAGGIGDRLGVCLERESTVNEREREWLAWFRWHACHESLWRGNYQWIFATWISSRLSARKWSVPGVLTGGWPVPGVTASVSGMTLLPSTLSLYKSANRVFCNGFYITNDSIWL